MHYALRQLRCGISGPTGAGKSTLCRLLSKLPNVALVPEPIIPESLEALSTMVPPCSWKLQQEIVLGRERIAAEYREPQILIFDRTISEDREVFFRLHQSLGYLTREQVANLDDLSIKSESAIGKPDLMILTTASADTIRRRIQADAVHRRPRWILASLDFQMQLYIGVTQLPQE